MGQTHKPYSLEEAAVLLKVGTPTIQSLIDQGLLVSHEQAGQTLIGYDDLIAFLRADQRALFDHTRAGAQPEA